MELAGYYLSHEEERVEIAKKGYEKVKQHHTWESRVMEMFEIVGMEFSH